MTWQRIDDDTCIDDSLVTCAEYQLFIDEMHEMGENYQPDHWTSHQFPKGKAHKPILGVRLFDTDAFCDWLRKKEKGNWAYTLPNTNCANLFPIEHVENNAYGYWCVDNFEWVVPRPEHVQKMDPSLINGYFVRANNQYGPYDLRFLDDFERRTSHNYPRAVDIESAVSNLLLNTGLNSNNHPLVEWMSKVSEVSRTDFSSFDFDFILLNLIDFAYSERYYRREFIFELFMEVLTLQERIAGRSPAFEGIRLVKERIK